MGLGISSNSVITNLPQTFTALIEGNNILQMDFYGNRQIVGVTKKAYEELEKISSEYYNKLVELGAIVPEKSPADVQAEMLAGMTAMLDEIKSLKQEVEVLKNDQSTVNSTDATHEPAGQSQIGRSMGYGAEHSGQGAVKK